MKKLIGASLIMACVVLAQTPNFSGVWTLNKEKSKRTGPPADITMIVDQQADKIVTMIGTKSQRGLDRQSYTYALSDKPSMNGYMGASMRTKASLQGTSLTLTSQIAQAKPGNMTEEWTLSPDGNTLTVMQKGSMGGREMANTLVYDKATEAAAADLRKPEETAGAHYKNVQILKDMPASQLINTMRSFNLALGAECNFCHVEGNFTADDKPQKGMARKMLTMVHDINEKNFNGRMEVVCYTCHQGNHEPMRHPPFTAQTAATTPAQ